jgi:hypothetical protein
LSKHGIVNAEIALAVARATARVMPPASAITYIDNLSLINVNNYRRLNHARVRTIPKRRPPRILQMENALVNPTIGNPYTPAYHYGMVMVPK